MATSALADALAPTIESCRPTLVTAQLALAAAQGRSTVSGAHMSAALFESQDAAYLRWLQSHPDGYMLNMNRNPTPADATLHRARASP